MIKIPSEGEKKLTGRGEELARKAGEVMDAILLSDFTKRGGRRKLRLEFLEKPLFVELHAVRKPNAISLAAMLLKFYEQSLAIAIAREAGEKTHDFWNAQQKIKQGVLGSKFEEKKYLGIFHGLDFLAGQKIHYGSELGRKRLLASVKEKIEVFCSNSNRKDTRCGTTTAQI